MIEHKSLTGEFKGGRFRGFKATCLVIGALLIAAIPSCQEFPFSEVVEVTPAAEAFEVAPGVPAVKITTLSTPATALTSNRVSLSLAPDDIELSNASAQRTIQVAGALGVDIFVSPADSDACAEGLMAAGFDVAVENGVPVSVDPPLVQAPDAAAAILTDGNAALCTSVSAGFSASVIIRRLNVSFETGAGGANGNNNDNANANSDDSNGNINLNDNGNDNNGNDNSDDDIGNDNLNDNGADDNGNGNLNDNGADDNGNDNLNDNGADDNGNSNGG